MLHDIVLQIVYGWQWWALC